MLVFVVGIDFRLQVGTLLQNDVGVLARRTGGESQCGHSEALPALPEALDFVVLLELLAAHHHI